MSLFITTNNFITNHPILFSTPMFIVSAVVVIMYLGMYFCTDYYDSFKKYLNKTNIMDISEFMFMGTFAIILELIFILTGDAGIANSANLALNMAIITVLFIPLIFISIRKSHLYFKQKRGKL